MRYRRRGIAYVDVFVSMVIVSLAIVAGLHAFGVFAKGSLSDRDTAIAMELASQLAAEIRGQAFEDSGAPVFGPESGETDGTRNSFDDVDDYNNWSASPPKRRDGTAMTDYQDYTQQASVALYGSANQKKITVTIKKGDRVLAEVVLLRSRNDAETQ